VIGGGWPGVTVNVVWALARAPRRPVCAAVIVTGPGLTVPGTRTNVVNLPSACTVTPLATYNEPTLIDTRPHGAGQNPLPVTFTVVSGGPAPGLTAMARTAARAGATWRSSTAIVIMPVIASLRGPTVRSYTVVGRSISIEGSVPIRWLASAT
jgi:hypothetical protein